jgi:serine/threonine protein phosphatase PrpC
MHHTTPVLLGCRSLGDFTFKQPRPLLLCEPHVVHQQLLPCDSLLLLVSDGVTDALADDDVMCIAMCALEQVSNHTVVQALQQFYV